MSVKLCPSTLEGCVKEGRDIAQSQHSRRYVLTQGYTALQLWPWKTCPVAKHTDTLCMQLWSKSWQS